MLVSQAVGCSFISRVASC